jgi:hypothetical protein
VLSNNIYQNVKIKVPLYPYDKERLMDPLDNSLTYYTRDNLVFDATLNDIYGNKINVDVSNLKFDAKFVFGWGTMTFQ